MREFDVAIVGAGIAGASAAYFLAPHLRLALIERESQPGYHTTGRSAALFSETYGNATIRALTRASRAFFSAPPAGFAADPLLAPRGALFFAGPDQRDALEHHAAEFAATGAHFERLHGPDVLARVPALKPQAALAGILEPDAEDIDVHALLGGFLRGARAHGAQVMQDAALVRAERGRDAWLIDAGAQQLRATVLVNAAGAWADDVARQCGAAPLGLAPMRRTAIVFECPRHGGARNWPMAVNADETLYFRPEAGRFLASPADETPSAPCDAQPEEIDVAMLIERLQEATTFDIRRITARWAGLRTFARDRTLVAGFDPAVPGLFWLAGQGGYGIQTAPAMGLLTAALVRGLPMPLELIAEGITVTALAPTRF